MKVVMVTESDIGAIYGCFVANDDQIQGMKENLLDDNPDLVIRVIEPDDLSEYLKDDDPDEIPHVDLTEDGYGD